MNKWSYLLNYLTLRNHIWYLGTKQSSSNDISFLDLNISQVNVTSQGQRSQMCRYLHSLNASCLFIFIFFFFFFFLVTLFFKQQTSFLLIVYLFIYQFFTPTITGHQFKENSMDNEFQLQYMYINQSNYFKQCVAYSKNVCNKYIQIQINTETTIQPEFNV